MEAKDFKVGQTLYFWYGYKEPTSAKVKTVNKKTVTLHLFEDDIVNRLKTNKMSIEKLTVKGDNDHRTLHLITHQRYLSLKLHRDVDAVLTKEFGSYCNTIPFYKRRLIAAILSSPNVVPDIPEDDQLTVDDIKLFKEWVGNFRSKCNGQGELS